MIFFGFFLVSWSETHLAIVLTLKQLKAEEEEEAGTLCIVQVWSFDHFYTLEEKFPNLGDKFLLTATLLILTKAELFKSYSSQLGSCLKRNLTNPVIVDSCPRRPKTSCPGGGGGVWTVEGRRTAVAAVGQATAHAARRRGAKCELGD